MALIHCPECGQTISDKAKNCPKCGYPIAHEEKDSFAESEVIVPKSPLSNPRPKNKVSIIAGAIALIAIIGIVSFLVKRIFSTVSVADINITTWKVTNSTSYGNYYEATITSKQKKPFIAVIGSYYDEELYPQLVFVNGGEGKFEVYASDDEDPSLEHYPIGYYQVEEFKSSDLSVKYKETDYNDWSWGETNCDVDINVKVNKKLDGFLFVNIKNITYGETDYNLSIPIINGEGNYSYYADLPYKSRGIEIEVSPVCLVKSKPLSETDYTVDKSFSVQKDEGTYRTYYRGEGVWTLPEREDGLILYTMELTAGGDETEHGKIQNRLAFLHNHKVTIKSYDSTDGDDDILMPQYSINLIGYLPWVELTKE